MPPRRRTGGPGTRRTGAHAVGAAQRQALHTYQGPRCSSAANCSRAPAAPTRCSPLQKGLAGAHRRRQAGPRGRVEPTPQAGATACRALPPGPTLQEMGFEPTGLDLARAACGCPGAQQLLQDFAGRIDRYDRARDFPAVKGPATSAPTCALARCRCAAWRAWRWSASPGRCRGRWVWLSELVWRDFYFQIPAPPSACGGAQFQARLRRHRLGNGHARPGALFAAWCDGRTGYPLVDAAMAQTCARATCTTACAWWWPVSCQGPGHRLALGRAFLRCTSTTTTWRRTTAAGSGPAPVAATRSPTSASSTRCARAPLRPAGQVHPPLPAASWPHCPTLLLHAPWEASPLELLGCGRGAGARLPLPIVDDAGARAHPHAAVVKAA